MDGTTFASLADKCVPTADDLANFGGRFEEREYDNRTTTI